MRGSPVEFGVVAIGLLGFLGLVGSDFMPSTGLLVFGCVIAVAFAFLAISLHPKPKKVYSPLQGERTLRSPFSPVWIVFPMALVAGWLFTVYGLGMTLAGAAGTQHTRQGTVVYSRPNDPSPRSRRKPCTVVAAVVQTGRGPLKVYHCETSLGGNILWPGTPVTYRTRESALGMFIELQFDWSQVNAAVEMSNRAQEQARRAAEAAARK